MWIAEGCAQRFRQEYDVPKTLSGWLHLSERLGMVVEWAEIPFDLVAFRITNVMILSQKATTDDLITAIRHEIAHWTMHRGNALWWQRQPMGELMIAKMERQANELAGLLR